MSATIEVKFNDGKEICANSYSLSKYQEKFVLKFANPEDCDAITDFIGSCDQSKIVLMIKYPNREKTLTFINYYMTLSFFNCTQFGSILEIHFEREAV